MKRCSKITCQKMGVAQVHHRDNTEWLCIEHLAMYDDLNRGRINLVKPDVSFVTYTEDNALQSLINDRTLSFSEKLDELK